MAGAVSGEGGAVLCGKVRGGGGVRVRVSVVVAAFFFLIVGWDLRGGEWIWHNDGAGSSGIGRSVIIVMIPPCFVFAMSLFLFKPSRKNGSALFF